MIHNQYHSGAEAAQTLSATLSVDTKGILPDCAQPPVTSASIPEISLQDAQGQRFLFPTAEFPFIAAPQPLPDDAMLLTAVRRSAVVHTLAQSENDIYADRLLQAAALLNRAPHYQTLLDPRYFSTTPIFHIASMRPDQVPSNPNVSLVSTSEENSGASSADVSALKIQPSAPLAPAGSFPVGGGHQAEEDTRKIPAEEDENASYRTTDNFAITCNRLMAAAAAAAPCKKKKKLAKKGMPRRPLTAYNLFFRDERAKILADIKAPAHGNETEDSSEASIKETPSQLSTEEFLKQRVPGSKRKRQRPHGKIGFRVLATMIGERWKELPKVDGERAARYREIATEDMKRYLREMKEYREKEGREAMD